MYRKRTFYYGKDIVLRFWHAIVYLKNINNCTKNPHSLYPRKFKGFTNKFKVPVAGNF